MIAGFIRQRETPAQVSHSQHSPPSCDRRIITLSGTDLSAVLLLLATSLRPPGKAACILALR